MHGCVQGGAGLGILNVLGILKNNFIPNEQYDQSILDECQWASGFSEASEHFHVAEGLGGRSFLTTGCAM